MSSIFSAAVRLSPSGSACAWGAASSGRACRQRLQHVAAQRRGPDRDCHRFDAGVGRFLQPLPLRRRQRRLAEQQQRGQVAGTRRVLRPVGGGEGQVVQRLLLAAGALQAAPRGDAQPRIVDTLLERGAVAVAARLRGRS
ncbi:hypothetical protein G4Q83_20655 [Xanthomonas theicola]|nr:hypothetical protein G4Q83_20655 [Xanthomonas theicola]